MKQLLASTLIFVATNSWAEVPVRFDHTVKIDTSGKNMKSTGDTECINLAKMSIPNEQFVTRLSTEVSTCGAVQGVATGNNATCTQPYIMGGLYDLQTGMFSVSQDTRPQTDPQKRVLLRVRNGQVGMSSGSYEIRIIAQEVWLKWIHHEKKAAVEVPYLCNITMPAQVTFR